MLRSPSRDALLSVTFEGPAVPSQQRDLRLDFFRGLALIFIFIDHIPENVLSYFTPQAFQFYDAAEVFIFISGYTAALVYGRTLASRAESSVCRRQKGGPSCMRWAHRLPLPPLQLSPPLADQGEQNRPVGV